MARPCALALLVVLALLAASAVPRAAALAATCTYCSGGWRVSCWVGNQSPPGPCGYNLGSTDPKAHGRVARLPSCDQFDRSATGSHNCAGVVCPDWVVASKDGTRVTYQIAAVYPYASACPDEYSNTECNPGWGQVCDAAFARRRLQGRKAGPTAAGPWPVTPSAAAPQRNEVDDSS